MRWLSGLCLLAMLEACAASHPSASGPFASKAADVFFSPDGPGPTLMEKVAGGYALSNRMYRVVISDQNGDVIFWSAAGIDRNTVFHRGIYTTLTGLPDRTPRGYVEKRDDQTWQFYGDDENHITWRKVYCLENNALLVSILIQNNRAEPLVTAIQIDGDLPSLRIQHHDPEQFTGAGGFGTVSLHGFNEFHTPASQPVLPTLIQSDTFHLKVSERQSYTSQWMLSQ